MLVAIVLLWVCIRLNAPVWCYVMLWIFATLQIVNAIFDFTDKKRKGRS